MPGRVHEVTFERIEDAAAFMAAVSRQARSPDTPQVENLRAEIELLAPGARVYLSDDLLLVAETVFGPVPRVSCERDSLAPALRASIDLGQAIGKDSIVQRLTVLFHDLKKHEVA